MALKNRIVVFVPENVLLIMAQKQLNGNIVPENTPSAIHAFSQETFRNSAKQNGMWFVL